MTRARRAGRRPLAAGARSGAARRFLLGDTPQTLLLAAEAALAGREDMAADAFKALAGRLMRFLGLRGLLRQAMQREDWDAAHRLARKPTLPSRAPPGCARNGSCWRCAHDWREALALAPWRVRAALALRRRAETDPARAGGWKSRPSPPIPASPGGDRPCEAPRHRQCQAGPRRAGTGLGHRAASRYRCGLDHAGTPAVLARVKAVEDLIHRNPDHLESRLLMARVALDAGLTGRARAELDALVTAETADRRAFLMLAELERPNMATPPMPAPPRPAGCAARPMPRRAGLALRRLRGGTQRLEGRVQRLRGGRPDRLVGAQRRVAGGMTRRA